MTEPLPAPPVPADADLTDFKFMPLEVARLRRSKAWLICKRRPELAFFMLNLWTVSWHERPAGSLEDDDDVLADAAMCSPERWAKVRAEVLRGWFKAADGRLYHPVVAEKVADSWHGKAVARWSKECDRIRKENHKRKENQEPPLDFPPKPTRNAAVLPLEVGGIPPEKPLKGEGRDREGKGEEERKEEAAPASPTGAGAPRSDDDPGPIPEFLKAEPDVKTAIFGAGLAWMIDATKASESSCRSFLGQLIGQHGEDETARCLLAAARTKPVDPRAWMKRNIGRTSHGPGPRNHQAEGINGLSPALAGISAALARRSVPPGGRDPGLDTAGPPADA